MSNHPADDTRRPQETVPANMAELLAHALALEIEASERYADLAELMESHNNYEISKLFMKMADIEKLHVQHIRDKISELQLAEVPVRDYHWLSPEGPETTDPADMHYLMKPAQALNLALYNEQRAYEYYAQIAAAAQDQETRRLAQELSEEEEQHVALVRVWLDKFPPTGSDWDYDDDPPNYQD